MSEQPLAARMRPREPAEFVGQTHLVGPGRALTKLIERGALPSLILWGPAGTGKTTLAHLLADAVGAQFTQLSAVNSGVADARKVMDGARGGLFKTILFVDEVHRWSKAQQDVLLPAVEDGTVTLIGATTENPYFSLNTPLLSRCILMRLEPLAPEDLAALIHRALADEDRGLGALHLEIDADALRAPRDGRRRRRPDRVDRPRGLGPGGGGRGRDDDHARIGVRRRAADGRRLRPAGRRALRRDQRVHQVDPGLRRRRGVVLVGEDGGGGRGSALHRPAADRPRVRGRRDGGQPRAARRGRGRAGRRARRAPRSEDQPRTRHDLPGARAEVEQRDRGDRRRAGRTRSRPIRCRRTCATPPTRGRSAWGTGRATSTRTTGPGTGPSRSTGLPATRARATTQPSGMGEDTEAWAPGAGPSRPEAGTR